MALRIRTAFLASISLAAFATPVLADSSSIETVVVTAEKRAEEMKNVPIAMSAISGQQLNEEHATSFQDYVNQVPGLNYTSEDPTHTQLILRGIDAGGDGSTVATYVDETPFGSSSSLANGVDETPNLDPYDMVRIEVLRGPQGTLYGSSSEGGLLKFVTNAPNPDGFAESFDVSGSTMDGGGYGWSVHGMVNMPLSPDAALRVVAYHDDTPGYIDDPFLHLTNVNGISNTGARVSALYDVNSKLSIRLTANLETLSTGATGDEDVTIVGANFFPKYGTYEQEREANELSKVFYGVYNATVNWDLDWATLTSATSYGDLHTRQLEDGTGALGVFVNARLMQGKFTEEVRLASPDNGGSLDWLIGGYYTNEQNILHQGLVATPTGSEEGFLQLNSSYAEEAVFASATYHFTPALDLQVGGRYSNNSQSADEFGLAAAQGSSSGGEFTWSVAPSYHLDDNTMLYARVAKGWRPGGPNVLPIGGGTGIPAFYGPDSLINYEVGVKSDLFDGAVSLDVDAFYIDWSDIQLLVVAGTPPTAVNANAGKAQSDGVEWNIAWKPLDNLSLGFSGAYTDAHLTQATDPILVGAPDGAPLPYAPRWGAALHGEYRFDTLSDGITPFIGADWRYVGKRYTTYGGGVVPPTLNQYPIAAYNTLDARVGFDYGNWSFELYGKNLTDSVGITTMSPTGESAASGTAATASVIAPREVGISLHTKL